MYVQCQRKLTSVQIKMTESDSVKIKAVLQEDSCIILKQKVGCSISKSYVPYMSVLRNSKLILQNAVWKCSLKSDFDKHGKT